MELDISHIDRSLGLKLSNLPCAAVRHEFGVGDVVKLRVTGTR